MTKKNDKLSKAELELMAELLFDAAELYSRGGDEDDYTLPASSENKELLRRVITTMYREAEQEDALREIEEEKDELSVDDWLLLEYFAQRCKKLAAKK